MVIPERKLKMILLNSVFSMIAIKNRILKKLIFIVPINAGSTEKI
jgi:hypothetical protein